MISYTLRIPDELYERIKRAAQGSQRSIHGELLWLLGQALRSEEGGES